MAKFSLYCQLSELSSSSPKSFASFLPCSGLPCGARNGRKVGLLGKNRTGIGSRDFQSRQTKEPGAELSLCIECQLALQAKPAHLSSGDIKGPAKAHSIGPRGMEETWIRCLEMRIRTMMPSHLKQVKSCDTTVQRQSTFAAHPRISLRFTVRYLPSRSRI